MTQNLWPAQDFYFIGGDKSPGKAIVTITSAPRGWEERKGYGLTGATLVPVGDGLITFKIRHEFWDQNQWPLWEQFCLKWYATNVVTTAGSSTKRVLNIDHPILKAPPNLVGPCVVMDPRGPEHDDYGLWYQTFDFKQWRKPIAAPSKPKTAIPDAANPQPVAQDAADREMQALDAQLTALQGHP